MWTARLSRKCSSEDHCPDHPRMESFVVEVSSARRCSSKRRSRLTAIISQSARDTTPVGRFQRIRKKQKQSQGQQQDSLLRNQCEAPTPSGTNFVPFSSSSFVPAPAMGACELIGRSGSKYKRRASGLLRRAERRTRLPRRRAWFAVAPNATRRDQLRGTRSRRRKGAALRTKVAGEEKKKEALGETQCANGGKGAAPDQGRALVRGDPAGRYGFGGRYWAGTKNHDRILRLRLGSEIAETPRQSEKLCILSLPFSGVRF